jgi:AcrR family transcriptional regulator
MIHPPDLAAPAPRSRRFDGRRLRSERTRQLIIEAYLALLTRNVRAPTASQIAAEAGYSVRSIFERFSDLGALSLATADHAIAAAQTEAMPRDVDADRPTRIRSHVKTRAQTCEKWLPLWRAMLDAQDQIEGLKSRVVLARQNNLERLRLMYRPELSILPEPERERLVVAMGVMTSLESWGQMRDCYGLTMDAAQAVWCTAIDRMLPS